MASLDRKRFIITIVVFVSLLAICIVLNYIPAFSHLEMIFRILPQAWIYLFFGFATTYVQSHYEKKEAENGAKYLVINNSFLKKLLIPENRIKESQGYIKIKDRNKITIFSVVLYLIGLSVVIGIIIMMFIPQISTKTIHVIFGGSKSHQSIEINTINSIFVYYSSMAYMILPIIGFIFRNIYFAIKSKKQKDRTN